MATQKVKDEAESDQSRVTRHGMQHGRQHGRQQHSHLSNCRLILDTGEEIRKGPPYSALLVMRMALKGGDTCQGMHGDAAEG